MKRSIKIQILNILVFFIVFLALSYLINIDSYIKAVICGISTWILSPKVSNFKSPAAEKIQFKWDFSEKTIVV